MDYFFIEKIQLFFSVYFIILYIVLLLSFFCSIYYSNAAASLKELPGVSLVKPLMGVDSLLNENLESFFLMSYPNKELLFCVHDDQDPALSLVESLIKKYPHVDSRIFIGGTDGIVNPMVSNMAPGYNNAKYELVWISSSRCKGSAEILMDMVGKIQDPNCAIVHQIPYTTDKRTFAGILEKVFFATDVARFYLTSQVLGLNCVTGMSYLVKKQLLDEVGGLGHYGKYLAEDWYLTKRLHDMGYRHQVASIPAQQNVAMTSVSMYKDRLVRWGRLRLNQIPHIALLLEPFSQCFTSAVCTGWAVYHLFHFNLYYFLITHCIVWIILDYLLLKGLQHGPLPFSKFQYLVAFFVREFLFVVVLIEALCDLHTINWGRRVYRVNFGGLTEVFFATDVARFYLTSQVLGLNCVTGMSYLVKKQLLDEVGGLGHYGKYLAEDWYLTKRLHDMGYRHQVASIPAQQNVAMTSVSMYKDRLVRWGRLRLNQIPHIALLLEPFSQCFTSAVCTGWAVYHLFHFNLYYFLITHCIVWIILDYLLLKGLQHGPLPFSKFQYLVAFFVREFLFVVVLIEALCDLHTINWGRRVYRVNFGGLTEVVQLRPPITL